MAENAENTENKIQAPDIGPSLSERFELLINARNFHYENYSKWMTYFYVAISALFIAFFTIASKPVAEVQDKQLFEFALLSLGYLVSLLWFWSSKGYYYWNINFISLVNYYETEVFKWAKEERIYKVFYDKTLQNHYGSPIGGANISTSKIAILFAYIISNFWGFMLFYKSLSAYCCCQAIVIVASLLLSIFVILISSLIIPKYILYSKIDEFPELKK